MKLPIHAGIKAKPCKYKGPQMDVLSRDLAMCFKYELGVIISVSISKLNGARAALYEEKAYHDHCDTQLQDIMRLRLDLFSLNVSIKLHYFLVQSYVGYRKARFQAYARMLQVNSVQFSVSTSRLVRSWWGLYWKHSGGDHSVRF